MHEGLAQSRVSRGALVQDDDDLRFDNQGDGGDERDGTETYSFREGYYLAILVRLGLILLEFGSR